MGRSRRGGLGAAWLTAGWWKSAGKAEHPALPRRRLLHKASCHPVQCGVSGVTRPFQTLASSSGGGGSLRESSCSFVAVWRESEAAVHPLAVPLPAASTSQPRLILSPLQPVGGTAQAAASVAVSALLVLLLELQ